MLSALDYAMLSDTLRPGVQYALERGLPLNEVLRVLRHNVIDHAVGQMGRDLEDVSENVFEFKGGRRIVALIDEMAAQFSQWREEDTPEEQRRQVLVELLAYRSRGLGHMLRSLKAQNPGLWWPVLDAPQQAQALEELLEELVGEGLIEKTEGGSTTWYRAVGFSLREHVGQWTNDVGATLLADSPADVSQGNETFSLALQRVLEKEPLSRVCSFSVTLPSASAPLELNDIAHLISRRLDLLDKETRLEASHHIPTTRIGLAMAWVPRPDALTQEEDMKREVFGQLRSLAQKAWLDPEERRQFFDLLRRSFEQSPTEFEDQIGEYLRKSKHLDFLGSPGGIGVWSDKLLELDVLVHEAIKSCGPQSKRVRGPLLDMADELKHLSLYEAARAAFEFVLEHVPKGSGPATSHEVRATQGVAITLVHLGEAKQGLGVLEELLPRLLTDDEPTYLAYQQDLGEILSKCGQYERSRQVLEDVLSSRIRLLGMRDVLVAKTSLSLGSTHYHLSNYAVARRYIEDALGIMEPDAADVSEVELLSAKSAFAVILEELGEYERACEIGEEVLATRERLLGAEHHHTLVSRNNLALVYQELEQYDRAIAMLQEASRIKSKLYGVKHPSTLVTLHNLASTHAAMENYQAALELYETMSQGVEEAFEPTDKTALDILNKKAGILKKLGRLKESYELHEQLIELKSQSHGPESVLTTISVVSFADLLIMMGDLVGAKHYLEKALTIYQRAYPQQPGHPYIIKVQHLLTKVA